jgi:hypothetical protein
MKLTAFQHEALTAAQARSEGRGRGLSHAHLTLSETIKQLAELAYGLSQVNRAALAEEVLGIAREAVAKDRAARFREQTASSFR